MTKDQPEIDRTDIPTELIEASYLQVVESDLGSDLVGAEIRNGYPVYGTEALHVAQIAVDAAAEDPEVEPVDGEVVEPMEAQARRDVEEAYVQKAA